MKSTIAAFTLCIIAFFATASHADDIRCGHQLLSTGASLYEAKAICGEPDHATHRTGYNSITDEITTPCADRTRRARCTRFITHTIEVVIDEWTYDFGPHRFMAYLRFENGRLVSIRDGGYGKKEQ